MNIKFGSMALALSLGAFMSSPSHAHYNDSDGETLYTLSNAANNSVYAYRLDTWGNVLSSKQFSTGGKGTGVGLGNQGALALSEDQRYLFAVNAGSNEVSVFKVNNGSLVLLDHIVERGVTPVSVAVNDDLVYVVNSGDDSIFGYKFDRRSGKLRSLNNSYKQLGATGTGAAQISFDKDGDTLVVTEKAIDKITSFELNWNGIPVNSFTINSSGKTPFGFAFGRGGKFFVSEAQGGAANGATASSYQLKRDGQMELISGAVAVGQTAACWLATTPNGRMAFTTDTPASSISSFAIDRTGKLSLLNTQAAVASKPTDLAMSNDGSLLYSLNTGDHTISIFGIERNGNLENITTINSIPAGATGLIVIQDRDYDYR